MRLSAQDAQRLADEHEAQTGHTVDLTDRVTSVLVPDLEVRDVQWRCHCGAAESGSTTTDVGE
ncbi:MAG: hypothetical protein ABW360_02785 [Phenylobacterium sp.]